MKILRGCFLVMALLFSSISFALPAVHLSPAAECNPATDVCLYVSTNIAGVQTASYKLNANVTLEAQGQKKTIPISSVYDNPTDYLWMAVTGTPDAWIVDFTSFTISSAGVNTVVSDIHLCQAISIPTTIGKHFLQISGTTQSISCSVQ